MLNMTIAQSVALLCATKNSDTLKTHVHDHGTVIDLHIDERQENGWLSTMYLVADRETEDHSWRIKMDQVGMHFIHDSGEIEEIEV